MFGNPHRLECTVDDADEPSDKDDIAIMKKQMANRTSNLSSWSRAFMAVEEHQSVSHYTPNLNTNKLYNDNYNQGLNRIPTASAIAMIVKEKMVRNIGNGSSQYRLSMTVEEDVSVAHYADNGMDDLDSNASYIGITSS